MPTKGEVLSFQATTAQGAEKQTEALWCDNENRNAYKGAQNAQITAKISFKVLYGLWGKERKYWAGNAEGDEMIRETHNQKQESYLTKIKGFKSSLGGHNTIS